MNQKNTSEELIPLSGKVERINFSEAESGFSVARFQLADNGGSIIVVGNLIGAAPGVILDLEGHWTDHPRYGRQFSAIWSSPQIPATREGIQTYLGSGLIRGIGPTLAKRIVEKFGKKTIAILERERRRLLEVNGIGEAKLALIEQSWVKHKEIHDVMLFLQSHGISPTLAGKIIKIYGHDAIARVRQNPFELADNIRGVGFLTADRIAAQLGFDTHSSQRIQAGVLYVLNQCTEEGHVFYPYEDLISRTRKILKTEGDVIEEALTQLARMKKIVAPEFFVAGPNKTQAPKVVYLTPLFICETKTAQAIRRLSRAPLLRPHINAQQARNWIEGQLKLQMAQRQAQAVDTALTRKLLIITGGPGTGKTTIIRAITRLYERLRAQVLLAAPTGRAAKRMGETTGRPAKTIHRLLEFSPTQGVFQRDDQRPLECELLIVDEVSMIDAFLMHHLLKAVPSHATLILVGDQYQLPSVGPGNILKDMIESQVIKVVTLNEIFRQAKTSRIVVNAHRINAGQMPKLEPPRGSESDFFFIQQNKPEAILETILKVTSERIPKRFGLDPIDDIQVITPMHRGIVGAENLNRQLQQLLNPRTVYLKRGDQYFHLNDKVMQIRNNYTKEVFNGDIGRIAAIDSVSATLSIRFDDRLVPYDYSELEDIVPAYAISIHKSQGSEYAAVVIPMTPQHYIMLQRNLLYTAVTRGKRLVVMVGDHRALAIAVKNNTPQNRYTYLAQRLIQAFEASGRGNSSPSKN